MDDEDDLVLIVPTEPEYRLSVVGFKNGQETVLCCTNDALEAFDAYEKGMKQFKSITLSIKHSEDVRTSYSERECNG